MRLAGCARAMALHWYETGGQGEPAPLSGRKLFPAPLALRQPEHCVVVNLCARHSTDWLRVSRSISTNSQEVQDGTQGPCTSIQGIPRNG